jgi:hypothetical protein
MQSSGAFVTLLNPTDLRQPSHTHARLTFLPLVIRHYTKKKRRVMALSRPISDHPRAPLWNFLFSPNAPIPMHSLHN